MSLLAEHTVAATWPIIEMEHLKTTLPQWMTAVYAIIRKFGEVAASFAVKYIQDTRPANLPRYTATYGALPSYEQVSKSLDWATRGLYDPQPNARAIETVVQGVVQKLVQDSARNTYIDNFTHDTQIVAWARIAQPNACSFCALLATRGAVYKTETTAGFPAHDHCHCVPVMVFRGETYKSPDYVQEWLRIYKESTSGLHNAAARNAFRRALAHN